MIFRTSNKYVLIEQGSKINSMYFVESGTLGVYVKTASGDLLRLRKLKEGACIGEISMYLDQSATASIISKEDCVLWELTPEAERTIGR